MYSFFIAIIGCIILAIRFSKDSSSQKDHDIKQKSWEEKYYKLNEIVYPPTDVYWSVKEYVESGKNVEEIYECIKDDLISIFGDDYRDYFILDKSGYPSEYERNSVYYKNTIYNSSIRWAEELIYSKKGYCSYVISGFTLGDHGHKYNDMKFCQRILKNLKANGVEKKLGFSIDIDLKKRERVPGIGDVDDYYRGKVKFIFGD